MSSAKKNCPIKGLQVYQSLKTGDTDSHVSIFDPALRAVAPLTFSLVLSPPPYPSLCE